MPKVGIEIHQRLKTAHKLFCRCATSGSGAKIAEVQRRLHPVPSELGEIDVAAQFEELRGRTFTYDVYERTVCEICADEAPPMEINGEAVQIALEICKAFGADVVDELQVMRKIVLDGSTIMSFQRTVLIGLGGKIKTSFGEISIPTLCLEEESAGIIGEVERAEVGHYRLDRLGIPLIEIATAADIRNGREAREVAEQIGLMLRVMGKVQRGIGTIRQDINVSVEGGARVEIKGVQALELIEDAVDKEIARQRGLIELCKKIKELPKEPMVAKDVTHIFKRTGCKFIREAIWRGEKVFAAKFPGMKGLFNEPIYQRYTYGAELNGYARAVGAGGIIHSDENMLSYGFMEEIKEMEEAIGCGERDGWIIVVGPENLCKKALQVVYERAYLTCVPEETRHVLLDGSSEYMRPLPGAARMYPETDVPPLKIDKSLLAKIKPVNFKEIKARVEQALSKDLADQMIKSENLPLFLRLVDIGIDPTIAAVTLEQTMKYLRREKYNVDGIPDEKIIELFEEYQKGLFVKAAIREILIYLSKNLEESVERIAKEHRLTKIAGNELVELIKRIKAKSIEDILRDYRLRVDPKEAEGALKEIA